MKKIVKILSSVLAASMLVSSFAINAFAVRGETTYTVVADKTTALAAGDVVTVEVQVDELLGIWNAGYELSFDPEVFSIDTTAGGRGKPKLYTDATWYAEVTDANGIIGWYWGAPTPGENAEAGTISYGWAGSTAAGEGVPAVDNQTDYPIGKFFLKVNENAPDGDTTITVSGTTFGFGENTADAMTYVPATLTVGTPAPDKTDVVVAPVASYDKSDAFEKDGAEYYHAAFKKEITVTADNNAVAGLTLEADKAVDVMFDTVVKDGTVNVAINILNVPAGSELGTITITPIAE